MSKNKKKRFLKQGHTDELTQAAVDQETKDAFAKVSEESGKTSEEISEKILEEIEEKTSEKTTRKIPDEILGEEDRIRRKKTDINKKKWRIIGFSAAAVQLVISVILTIYVLNLNILPDKYLVLIFMMLVILVAITACAQIPKKTRIGGLIFGCIVSIVLVVGCVYLGRTQNVLDTVTVSDEENYKVDNIVVAVLKDDQAQTMDDALLYNFGIQKTLDRSNTDTVIAEIEANAGLALSVTEYEDFSAMVRALRKGEIQAIVYNAAYDDTIEESEENFTDEIRVLNSHEIKSKMNLTTSDMNVTQEPFTVYISGIDVYGEIEKTSRSDVNMLVTVNPQTKQIVMTTTPRDYFVLLPNVSGTYRDKLTHAGIYGVQCSMDTLSQLYGIQIDYYVRVNFTTLKKIVDALGGVNVYSEYEFTTHYKNGGYEIKKGYNQMDGKKALAFARERYNVPGGDEQRGRDQQAVLKALIEKAMSPSILTGYMGIMDSLEGSFETNMSMNQIASLVKMQLGDGASWDIKMQSVTGTYGNEACFSSGYQRLSIMYEDLESITKARNKILSIGGKAIEDTTGRFGTDPENAQPETDVYGNVTGGDTSGSGNAYTDSSYEETEAEFDSSLGDFAESPTARGESGLRKGFNYYKGRAETEETDDASELNEKIESQGTTINE